MSELIRLDAELKKTWVTALRGTAYVQSTGKLYTGTNEKGQHQMCCLGVLEHLCGTPIEEFKDHGMPVMLGDPKGPVDILRQMAPDTWPEKYSSVGHTFANLNDGGRSFEEIAQFIEENL